MLFTYLNLSNRVGLWNCSYDSFSFSYIDIINLSYKPVFSLNPQKFSGFIWIIFHDHIRVTVPNIRFKTQTVSFGIGLLLNPHFFLCLTFLRIFQHNVLIFQRAEYFTWYGHTIARKIENFEHFLQLNLNYFQWLLEEFLYKTVKIF